MGGIPEASTPQRDRTRSSAASLPDWLSDALPRCGDRVAVELEESMPHAALDTGRWLRGLSPTGRAEDRFRDPLMFPLLQLPWWLERHLVAEADPALQEDILYSSLNGYYFIRLIDDLMDAHRGASPRILPAAAHFHCEFIGTYQKRFGGDPGFWGPARRHWSRCNDSVAEEARAAALDLDRFLDLASRKFCAAKIPLVAVCAHHSRRGDLEGWESLCDALGACYQMMDDLFDWLRDSRADRPTTFLLSEAARRARPGEALLDWMVREGWSWGVEQVENRFDVLEERALEVGSRDVVAHLDATRHLFRERAADIAAGFAEMAKLGFGGAASTPGSGAVGEAPRPTTATPVERT